MLPDADLVKTVGGSELLTLLPTTDCLSHTFVVEFSIWVRGFLSMQNTPKVSRILHRYNFHRECNSSMFRVSGSATGEYRPWKRSAHSRIFYIPLVYVCIRIYVFIYALRYTYIIPSEISYRIRHSIALIIHSDFMAPNVSLSM